MRNIINISLPASMVEEVQAGVKSGGFASVSEYIRHIIRSYRDYQLYRDIEKSRAEFRAGKGKVLRSFKDLR